MIYTLRQFSNPDILSKIDRKNLHSLLIQHSDYFKSRNSNQNFLADEITDDFDFLNLAREFENPLFDIDNDLFDSLKIIETMARPKYAPFVLDYLEETSYKCNFSAENLSLDNALLVYLKEPKVLYRIQQELAIENPKNFTVLKGKKAVNNFEFKSEHITILQKKLDDVYEHKKFGRGIVVKHYNVNDEHYFLIRKGSPYTYQSTIGQDLTTIGIYYRAEFFDLVIYSPQKHELKLAISNARKWMKTIYPLTFSEVLFGTLDMFEERRCLSFTDFQERGEKAIKCNPEDGISKVIVTEIISEQYSTEKNLYDENVKVCKNEQINRNDDFFQHGAKFKLFLNELGTITGLKMVFHFGARDKRVAMLKNGNGYGFKMDAKGILIERWLYERGFIING